MWLLAHRVLTVTTPWGRKLRDHFLHPPRGIPLARVRLKDLAEAGVERVARTAGMKDGYPLLEDGRVLPVSNVVWCTGFRWDYGWIDVPLRSNEGIPLHERGVVASCPGLYFVGLPFLHALSSPLLGGVGRDAEHVVEHIASARRSSRRVGAPRVGVFD
jgi:putative flavoprotein involved in K+ transport